MKSLPITLLILLFVVSVVSASTVSFTVKDRYIIGFSTGTTGLIIEDINDNVYSIVDLSMMSAIGDKTMIAANQYKPNTTHTVMVDECNRIQT